MKIIKKRTDQEKLASLHKEIEELQIISKAKIELKEAFARRNRLRYPLIYKISDATRGFIEEMMEKVKKNQKLEKIAPQNRFKTEKKLEKDQRNLQRELHYGILGKNSNFETFY